MSNMHTTDVVENALVEAAKRGAWESVSGILWGDVYVNFTGAVDRAMGEAVEGATFTAMRNDSDHPGLQDFLRTAKIRES